MIANRFQRFAALRVGVDSAFQAMYAHWAAHAQDVEYNEWELEVRFGAVQGAGARIGEQSVQALEPVIGTRRQGRRFETDVEAWLFLALFDYYSKTELVGAHAHDTVEYVVDGSRIIHHPNRSRCNWHQKIDFGTPLDFQSPTLDVRVAASVERRRSEREMMVDSASSTASGDCVMGITQCVYHHNPQGVSRHRRRIRLHGCNAWHIDFTRVDFDRHQIEVELDWPTPFVKLHKQYEQLPPALRSGTNVRDYVKHCIVEELITIVDRICNDSAMLGAEHKRLMATATR